jgi:hypothetical protein
MDPSGTANPGGQHAPSRHEQLIGLPPEGVSATAGTTAICPRCGIDSVLPDNTPGVPLNTELLTAMCEYFF